MRVSALVLWGLARCASGGRVEEVVQMMEKLQASCQEAMHQEKLAFIEFDEFCKSAVAETRSSRETAAAEVERLRAERDKAKLDVQEVEERMLELARSIQSFKEEGEAAKSVRKKDAVDAQGTLKQLGESYQVVERALSALRSGSSEALRALPELLEDLKVKIKEQRIEVEGREVDATRNHELLVKRLDQTSEAAKLSLVQQEVAKDNLLKGISSAESDLQVAEAAEKEDSAKIQSIRSDCLEKAAIFEKNQAQARRSPDPRTSRAYDDKGAALARGGRRRERPSPVHPMPADERESAGTDVHNLALRSRGGPCCGVPVWRCLRIRHGRFAPGPQPCSGSREAKRLRLGGSDGLAGRSRFGARSSGRERQRPRVCGGYAPRGPRFRAGSAAPDCGGGSSCGLCSRGAPEGLLLRARSSEDEPLDNWISACRFPEASRDCPRGRQAEWPAMEPFAPQLQGQWSHDLGEEVRRSGLTVLARFRRRQATERRAGQLEQLYRCHTHPEAKETLLGQCFTARQRK
ncbi:unnamed protein product [Effrenium voratum]|nr:unnamed protein product [Effrenium voratum]